MTHSSISKNILIIDIGKTHIKLYVLNADFEAVFSKEADNVVDTSGIYPMVDVDFLWQWITSGIKEATAEFVISAMTVTTHGATAALINSEAENLVLPILDYEYTGIDELDDEYQIVKPDFNETYSPDLPAGLNLGKQIFWLQKRYPEAFAKTTDILMYPQYWAWRLTGQKVSEITSLGCHTDLWSMDDWGYSSLVKQKGWQNLFPTVVPAWESVGYVLPDLAKELGLPKDCQIHAGIHDSNASFLRYRLSQNDAPFTVISTGTWTITMAANVALSALMPNQDMLANIDATGKPIACGRFMGGREFDTICQLTGAQVSDPYNLSDIESIIKQEVYILPDFSGGSGPFGTRKGEIIGDVSKIKGVALASLYCALMIDYQLEQLAAQGDIYIEGVLLKNPQLCSLLAQLRTAQKVNLSTDTTGTVQGAACLTNWHGADCQVNTVAVDASQVSGLAAYKQEWLRRLAN